MEAHWPPPPTSSGSAPLLLDLHLRRHNRRKSSTKPNHFCMQLKLHFRTFGDFHSRYPYYVPCLVAGVGWDSLASIAAYHGAQATWPPLLTPSSSSSSIPQLPPPKLNNAHQHILLQQRYVAGCFEKPIYWSNEVLYVALLDVTNIWRLLCALWQGGGGTRQHHTATTFCTHSHTPPPRYMNEMKRSQTIQSFSVL